MRALAIGGPIDGRIINSHGHDYPAFAVREPRPFPSSVSNSPGFDEYVKHVRYQPFLIQSGTAKVEVFVPIDQSPEETLKRLINGYRIIEVDVL